MYVHVLNLLGGTLGLYVGISMFNTTHLTMFATYFIYSRLFKSKDSQPPDKSERPAIEEDPAENQNSLNKAE